MHKSGGNHDKNENLHNIYILASMPAHVASPSPHPSLSPASLYNWLLYFIGEGTYSQILWLGPPKPSLLFIAIEVTRSPYTKPPVALRSLRDFWSYGWLVSFFYWNPPSPPARSRVFAAPKLFETGLLSIILPIIQCHQSFSYPIWLLCNVWI